MFGKTSKWSELAGDYTYIAYTTRGHVFAGSYYIILFFEFDTFWLLVEYA